MKGIVKTYLPEKKYGFIKGDDGKDYFFHERCFKDKRDIGKICEESFVGFDQQATPKGYRAISCYLISSEDVLTYAVPDEFIASKSNGVRGWDIIEHSEWKVYGTSRDSPDAAKLDAIDSAKRIGANALVNLKYFKTTDSEPGTGKGTYYYTVHNFHGCAVMLAKKSARGGYRSNELLGINHRAESLKTMLDAKTAKSKKKRNIIWLIMICLSCIAIGTEPKFIFLWLILGVIFGRSTEYGDWIVRA